MILRLLVASALLLPFATAQIPSLKKQGSATQLMVDGKPFLVLGGELHNSSASSLEYMKPIWKKLKSLHLNTALATVSWELVEPEEGKYDFALVDGLIRDARVNEMKLVFLWFGSWKNGVSSYAPLWVKKDLARFPRAQNSRGNNTDILSPFADAARDADAKAFGALMRHIKQVDGQLHTVLMMQVENEVGVRPDARDHCPLAEEAWRKAVPAELMSFLQKNKDSLLPETQKLWGASDFRTSGAWPEVFGESPDAEEALMAWQMARYIGKVVETGKKEYALPMYVNAWLVQKEGQRPGAYPSGGPVSKVMDIWHAAAPQIDFLAPDIYLPDFKGVCASYTRAGNPLFIPEASRGNESAMNVFWAIGQHDAIGFAPFGIDSLVPPHPLADSYELLASLTPVLMKHQGQGKIAGILEGKEQQEFISLGGYKLRVEFDNLRSKNPDPAKRGYGLVIATGPDEFLAAGTNLSIVFSPDSPGPKIARIGYIDEGRYVNGKWVPGRRMNGDENAGGYKLWLRSAKPGIQRIKLYRHD